MFKYIIQNIFAFYFHPRSWIFLFRIILNFRCITLTIILSIFIIRIILIIRSSDPSSRIISSIFSWNVILFYYILATLLPIDKLIGKLYPVFGIILIVMALSIAGAIIFLPDYNIPEITLRDLHPDNNTEYRNPCSIVPRKNHGRQQLSADHIPKKHFRQSMWQNPESPDFPVIHNR